MMDKKRICFPSNKLQTVKYYPDPKSYAIYIHDVAIIEIIQKSFGFTTFYEFYDIVIITSDEKSVSGLATKTYLSALKNEAGLK